MTNTEYQKRELSNFLNQKTRYFDTVKEFSHNLETMDILGQIEWIENGSYGTGACLALQHTINSLSNRTNNRARVGAIALHAFYGVPFRYWQKLSKEAQEKMNVAVDKWMNQKHEWAMKLEI